MSRGIYCDTYGPIQIDSVPDFIGNPGTGEGLALLTQTRVGFLVAIGQKIFFPIFPMLQCKHENPPRSHPVDQYRTWKNPVVVHLQGTPAAYCLCDTSPSSQAETTEAGLLQTASPPENRQTTHGSGLPRLR